MPITGYLNRMMRASREISGVRRSAASACMEKRIRAAARPTEGKKNLKMCRGDAGGLVEPRVLLMRQSFLAPIFAGILSRMYGIAAMKAEEHVRRYMGPP